MITFKEYSFLKLLHICFNVIQDVIFETCLNKIDFPSKNHESSKISLDRVLILAINQFYLDEG